jgi:sulfoxide reductase heme-binding subunit YedZ
VTALAAVAAALPGAGLLAGLALGSLGPNPLEALIRESGRWTFILLLVTLALTPLRHALTQVARLCRARFGRRPADWNWMVRLRRPAGLACFCYAAAHAALYLCLDAGLDAATVLADLREKPFVGAGLAAFLLLVPLAITSSDAWMRRLKRGWKRLHRAVYAIGVLSAMHFLWLSKPGVDAPYAYAAAVALLLGYRVLLWVFAGLRASDALGEAAAARGPAPAANDAIAAFAAARQRTAAGSRLTCSGDTARPPRKARG